jgi:hypothetical protein
MYRVAKGHSFIGRGVSYKPGAEITEAAFAKREDFLRNVKSGRIVSVPVDETLDADRASVATPAAQETPAASAPTSAPAETPPSVAIPAAQETPAPERLKKTKK